MSKPDAAWRVIQTIKDGETEIEQPAGVGFERKSQNGVVYMSLFIAGQRYTAFRKEGGEEAAPLA